MYRVSMWVSRQTGKVGRWVHEHEPRERPARHPSREGDRAGVTSPTDTVFIYDKPAYPSPKGCCSHTLCCAINTAEEVAAHAVVARGRVGPGGRKSRGRVATGEVASPKGRGRVGLASRLPGVPVALASCRPWRPVGSASRPRWSESLVCESQSPFGKRPSRVPSRPSRVPSRSIRVPSRASRVPSGSAARPLAAASRPRDVASRDGDSVSGQKASAEGERRR